MATNLLAASDVRVRLWCKGWGVGVGYVKERRGGGSGVQR